MSPGPGGWGGTLNTLSCPPGSFAYGITGKQGALLDSFGLRCRDLATNSTTATAVLGGGGTPFTWDCAAGEYIFDVVTNSVNDIDGLNVRCALP